MSSESINYWSKTQQLHAQTHIVRNNLQPLTDVTVLSKLTLVSMGAKWLEVVLIQQGLEKWCHKHGTLPKILWEISLNKNSRKETSAKENKQHPTWRFQWESKQLVAFFFVKAPLVPIFFSFILCFPTLILAISPPNSPTDCHLLSEVLRHAVCSKSWYQIQILWKNNLTHGEFQSKNP